MVRAGLTLLHIKSCVIYPTLRTVRPSEPGGSGWRGRGAALHRARRPVLRIEKFINLKTGVAYDDQYCQPAAPAHDRGHERAQALCGNAARAHPKLQTVRCFSEAIS